MTRPTDDQLREIADFLEMRGFEPSCVDWSERNATIARQLGCSREAVRKMRARVATP